MTFYFYREVRWVVAKEPVLKAGARITKLFFGGLVTIQQHYVCSQRYAVEVCVFGRYFVGQRQVTGNRFRFCRVTIPGAVGGGFKLILRLGGPIITLARPDPTAFDGVHVLSDTLQAGGVVASESGSVLCEK